MAAAAGVGIAVLPHYIGRTQKGLKLCIAEPVSQSHEVRLLKRRQDRKGLPIGVAVDLIANIFADEQAPFAVG